MNNLGKLMVALSVLLCASLAMAGSGRREGPVISTPKVWGSNGSCQWGTDCPAIGGTSGPVFFSIWEDTDFGGTTSDIGDYELGVLFTVDSAVSPGGGWVHGIKFHKQTNNIGEHVGHLWRDSDQALMGTVVFANETAGGTGPEGWQTQLFASPIKVAPDTKYIATYSLLGGRFTVTVGGLSASKSNPPLASVASATDVTGNGRFNPTPGSFPGSMFNSTNYWVDLVWADDGVGEVLTIDDGEAGYAEVGAWSLSVAAGFQGDFKFKSVAAGAATATWTFDVGAPGSYRVSATWEEFTNRATNAPYTVLNGVTPLETVLVDQTAAPVDFVEGGVEWDDLGTYSITGSSLVVQLTDDAAPGGANVIADAIRVERISN